MRCPSQCVSPVTEHAFSQRRLAGLIRYKGATIFDVELLLAGYAAFFALTWLTIVRNDLFIGMVYFMLFLYSIAPMIAYAYHPFLSERISAEFGIGIFFDAYWFTTFSMVAFCVAFHLIGQPILQNTSFAT